MRNIKITTLIFILFHFLGCSQNNNRNDREITKLKGNVKCVVQRSYNVIEKFNKIYSGNPVISICDTNSKFCFDENGYFSTINHIALDGSVQHEISYTSIDYQEYIKIKYRHNNSKTEKRTYDENGNLLEEEVYYESGVLWYRIVNKYEKNNIIESRCYNEGKTLQTIEEMKYDENNILIEKVELNLMLNNKLITKYKYEMDENNNWTKKIIFWDDKPSIIVERIINYY